MESSKQIKPYIIAISNHKGGVGKTCSTCNLGAALSRNGKKVLLIDLDPQANLSLSLGIKDAERNIYELFQGKINIQQTIHFPFPRLDIIPSHLDLAGAEIELVYEKKREFVLKNSIDSIIHEYDYIFIDCPPSLGLLTTNALVASDEVIIPIQPEYLSLQGLEKQTNVISKIQQNLNPSLTLFKILITQYDQRKSFHRDIADKVYEFFGDKVYTTKIRNNISLAEATCKGKDIFRYSPKSQGVQDYESLCQEFLNQKRG
jgi:chromosome partitioning protein